MSENEQPTEDQNETAGEDAAKAELPVGDLNAPPNPPDQTAEQIAAEEAEKDAQASSGQDAEQQGSGDDPPDDDPEELAADAAIDQAQAAEARAAEPQTARSAGGLPLWRCHKTVEAFKIAEIQNIGNGTVQLIAEDETVAVCDAAYVDKHRPRSAATSFAITTGIGLGARLRPSRMATRPRILKVIPPVSELTTIQN